MLQPSESHRSPRVQTLSSGRIEVVFRWQEDRWVHSLHILQSSTSRGPACWQTALSGPHDDPNWPTSPPLVELAKVDSLQGAALVGVGQAGTSHFSVSVTAEAGGTLRFEAACRISGEPGWLGSAYTAVETTASQQLEIEPLSERVLASRTALSMEIRPLEVHQFPGEPPPKKSTVQWGYRVRPSFDR